MKLRKCNNKKDYQKYITFVKELYKNDMFYRDFITPVIQELGVGKSHFCMGLLYEAYLIEEDSKIIGGVIFIIPARDASVMQIGFLEYIRIENIAAFILREAKIWAKAHGAEKIVVGLNGHVNYGLGLSVSNSKCPSFGSVYTKDYYATDFETLGGKTTTLNNYTIPWNPKELPFSEHLVEKIMKNYEFKIMTAKTFKEDMAIYTEINNACFAKHRFYYPRLKEEDLELFENLRFFLEKGSLVFILRDKVAIGFFLWYPDYTSIMKAGETLSVFTFIKTLLFRKKVTTFKLVEWGVLPEYKGKGLPFALLYYSFRFVKNKAYSKCKTSWILDDNVDSNAFTKKFGEVDETYKVFEFE